MFKQSLIKLAKQKLILVSLKLIRKIGQVQFFVDH